MGQAIYSAPQLSQRATTTTTANRITDPTYDSNPIGVTPFIRENDINIDARNLKPDALANFFFDSIKVNDFTQRASIINVTSNTAFTTIKINDTLYGATSKAYAEVLGTSITANNNLLYVNDNFLSLNVSKNTGTDLVSTDYSIDDIVYQTADSNYLDFSIYTGITNPAYTFLGKVKKWEVLDVTKGVLVVDPILGRANTAVTYGGSSKIWNLTKFVNNSRSVQNIYANNRFQSGESLANSTGVATCTVSAQNSSQNSYVALSSVVSGANTVNLRSIVLSTNNTTRDGSSTIVGNTISIVRGTNIGFTANVVAVASNTLMGWTEAILDASMPAAPTSNSIYSIGKHVVDDVGALYGVFHLPSESSLRWLVGERVLTITDTATYNDNAYKMRAIAKYTALGKVNSTENARNFVLREQTPNTLQAASKITEATQKINDRKYMAQTFFTPKGNEISNGQIKNAYGVYISSIDLFFKAKPTAADELLPFTIAIAPIENGLPSNDIIATKTLEPAYIKVAAIPSVSNTATLTKFTFADPVYLLPSTEYAIKLITESADYEVWTATIGGEYTDDTGNTRRISEQPYVGSFFTSQNASNWNPILNQDLMFQVNRAKFSSSAQMHFNLLVSDSKKPNVVMDLMKINATEQQFSPTSVTYEVMTYKTDGTSAGYVSVNNNELYSFGKDTNISTASSNRRRLVASGNTESVNVRVTMSSSDDSVSPVLNKERFGFFALQNIINNAGIANNLISVTTQGTHMNAANIVVTISAPDITDGTQATANVTPALLSLSGTSAANTILGINIINPGSGYLSSPTITISEPSAATNARAVINGETDVSGGNILAKYQTKIVTLEDGFDAGDLVVRMQAIKPAGTDIAVYFKVLSALDADPFGSKKWQKMTKSRDNVSPDQDKRVPLEYRYSLSSGTIEYFDGVRSMPLGKTFKQFAVKIRLTASDPTVTPAVESLKVIAVPGG